MEKEDRAGVVELRRFTELLNKLSFPGWSDASEKSYKRRICFVRNCGTEKNDVVELAQSGNSVVDKCIMTFSSLVVEVGWLFETAQLKLFPALLLYGEDVSKCLESEGGAVKMIAEFLPFLQEVSVFVNRCYEVFHNIVLQMYSFYLIREDILERVHDRKMLRMWKSLGDLLSILIFLDEIIQKHPLLLSHWSFFLKSIQSIRHNPSCFGAESSLFKPLMNVILQIDSEIMTGYIFKNCCQQSFHEALHTDSQFSEEIRSSILDMYTKWERVATDDMADKRQLTVIISLTSLFPYLFQSLDKKLFKTVWNSHKRLAAFHVIGDIVWTPCEFLLKNIPEIEKIIDKKSLSAVRALRSVLIAQQAALLGQEVTTNSILFVEWQFKMDEELREWPKENIHGHLMHRTSLFLKGMRQADLLSRTVRLVLCGSLNEKRPLSRSIAIACMRFIEIIKAIESTFMKWWNEVLESVQQALQHWSGQLLRLIDAVKKSARSESSLSNNKVDIISALTVAELALYGSISSVRLTVTGIALEFACYTKLFRMEDREMCNDSLARMDILLNIPQTISRLCDCSFLFWQRSLISTYFDSLINDTAERLELFFAAITDVQYKLNACRHAGADELKEKFRSEIFEDFERKFLLKLCEAVETDLRLSIHSYLQPVEERLANSPVQDQSFHLKCLLQLSPLLLCGQFIDVKRYAELHLERAFYNLAAVALHDCHSYSEMRLLAREKYDLHLCESRLPFQTLDQGLDVLLITRNLHFFVSNYNYNLNGQFFIEKDSKNKHLNILSVEHIANSIRTHGTGIMNTVINFAYQYLKKKFYVFSQFLYDDHIKGQLIKEIRHFQANADQLSKMYPVKRAQRFNTAIKRLGVSDEGLSFLDKFRILITQIGNVMGYVRLVRSGSVEASSHSLAFLTDSDELVSFTSLASECQFATETVEAAKHLDQVLEETIKNVNRTNNYLQILVEVFSKELRNFEKYEHLSNFYIIVPSLTVNYTEAILACKGTLGRRTQQNFTFTDDGFILGVAFILTTLNQIGKFESLNWFASVEKRCEEEFKNAKQTKASTTRTDLEPSVKLRIAKLEHYQKSNIVEHSIHHAKHWQQENDHKVIIISLLAFSHLRPHEMLTSAYYLGTTNITEFRLLFYIFHSAKIFFRSYQDLLPSSGEAAGAGDSSE